LEAAIRDYLEHHNANPKPFVWTASAPDILKKVARGRHALESEHECGRRCDTHTATVVAHPPIWLMRQAGRYLPEYRNVRRGVAGFLDLCYTPDLAASSILGPLSRDLEKRCGAAGTIDNLAMLRTTPTVYYTVVTGILLHGGDWHRIGQ
jgi:hypothetical protein